ncbi:MAG: HlyD family efflux transporter periplasmic adaptor subunit [Burkholderiaceae bacterium]|nr:HlyD family efflux transporter periplasmic adaptor subunit [Burkholderiaceae bacterium]
MNSAINRFASFLSPRQWLVVTLLAACIGGALLLFPWSKAKETANPLGASWLPVQPQLLENRLGLAGRIEPATKLTITAPFEGTLLKLAVAEGQRVRQGQHLLTLDTTQLNIQLREALSELLKAQRADDEMRDWLNSDEVARARRSVSTAEMALKNTRAKLADTRRLFERGIVARMEVDELEQQAQQQETDLLGAQGELKAALAKGQGESRQIAEMAFVNAQANYHTLKALEAQREIRAPFAGIVFFPKNDKKEGNEVPIQAGLRATQGMALLEIAGLERFNAVARVEEADLHQLKEGMAVQVTGDGFEGITLRGTITNIGARGNNNAESPQGSATYDVTVSIDPKTTDPRVRLGMSARLSVLTYRSKSGFAVPAEAITQDEQGQSVVTYRKGRGDKPRPIKVTTGHAMPQGVEVFGLAPGYVSVPQTEKAADAEE